MALQLRVGWGREVRKALGAGHWCPVPRHGNEELWERAFPGWRELQGQRLGGRSELWLV